MARPQPLHLLRRQAGKIFLALPEGPALGGGAASGMPIDFAGDFFDNLAWQGIPAFSGHLQGQKGDNMEYAEIGIIGGSGFYDLEGLEGAHSVRLRTPFGAPSEKLMLGRLHGREVAFLSRHGHGHRLNPSEVNYRANLYAMKMLKVERLVSITAVGSLKEELKPGELVIPDQYVDQTFKREKTFSKKGSSPTSLWPTPPARRSASWPNAWLARQA